MAVDSGFPVGGIVWLGQVTARSHENATVGILTYTMVFYSPDGRAVTMTGVKPQREHGLDTTLEVRAAPVGFPCVFSRLPHGQQFVCLFPGGELYPETDCEGA